MRKIGAILLVALLVMATACTQYVLVPIPGIDGNGGGTTGINTSAETVLSFTTALDNQLPDDIAKKIEGQDVPGLYREGETSASQTKMMRASILVDTEPTASAKTFDFYFDGYAVAGYGVISTGNFTLTMTGTSTTDDSQKTIFTSESVSMGFDNIIIEGTSSTETIPITISNLQSKAEVTITTNSGTIKVEGIDKVSVTQSIATDTTISVGGQTVKPEDIAESNTGNDHTSGLGSEAYPYIISNATQFETLGSEKPAYYRLADDIVLPSDIYITDFYGVLDGAGNTISYSGNDYSTSLFWALRDGSVIRNLTIDLGTGTSGKQIATVTEGDVLIDNVTVEGTITVAGNNSGSGYISYVGYGDDVSFGNRMPANVTISNCTNRLNVYAEDYTIWGIAPFVSAYGMPNVEAESSLTLENCVNEGVLAAGYVGWIFGNQSGVEKIGSIKVSNCRNANEGSVTGYIDCGDISWNKKDESVTNIEKDASFANMVIDKSVDSNATLDSTDRTVTITPVPSTSVTMVEVIGRYQVTGYSDEDLTVTPAHITQNFVLATADNLTGTSSTIKLKAYNAVDSRAEGVTTEAETGDIVTIQEDACVFIGDEAIGGLSSIIHSCVDTTTHKHAPSSVWVMGYNGDTLEYVIQAK